MLTGRIGGVIELRDTAAKKGGGRIIPMHPHLRAALVAWRRCSREREYMVASERGGPMTPLSIVVWFNRAFVNGPRNLPSLGRAKFPTLAGVVINRWLDRCLHSWAAGRGAWVALGRAAAG